MLDFDFSLLDDKDFKEDSIKEPPKIPLELYVVSYINKCAKEGIKATFDEICWGVLKHLPKDQVQINDNEMILDILKRIAILNDKTGEWKLKTNEPKLFDDI